MSVMEAALLTVPVAIPMVALVGPGDSYLRIFESTFLEITITVRGNEVFAQGDLDQVHQFHSLLQIVMFKQNIMLHMVVYNDQIQDDNLIVLDQCQLIQDKKPEIMNGII